MATQNAPQDNYPFSTRDGQVIPLDILRSRSLLYQDFTALATAVITIPVGTTVAFLYATEDCVLVTESSADIVLAANTPITKGIIVPKDHAISVAVVEGAARVKGISASGRIYIQCIEQWAGIGLDINYRRK